MEVRALSTNHVAKLLQRVPFELHAAPPVDFSDSLAHANNLKFSLQVQLWHSDVRRVERLVWHERRAGREDDGCSCSRWPRWGQKRGEGHEQYAKGEKRFHNG